MLDFEIPTDTEEIVREAAKRLNSTVFEYRSRYKLDSADSYLRLAALQFATLAVENEYKEKTSAVTTYLKKIEETLEEHLSEQ